ncbi:ABC transporter permease [Nocardioides campestrisoli]|uniref:ABC transporter permease n=1 Tax=Nocardioides campestrisoli TaxID=2736757 RepID=UPI00163D808E|nr:ABC transporter permease [Nocardioides campestrisoli]
MLRAAIKSLLGRKVRLLMSTFAIVLGVAFVAGTLIFTDTLNRSFTALFASTVGDVVVRPEGADGLTGTTRTIPASLVRKLEKVDGVARVDGNVTSSSVMIIGADGKALGGLGAPGLAGNWTGAPAGHGLTGMEIVSGREPEGPGEILMDAGALGRSGYSVGDEVQLITTLDRPLLTPTLVGVVDFADGGSLNGASWVGFETKVAQRLFLDGRPKFNDVWVSAEPGVSQADLRERVAPELPGRLEARTGDDVADESASALLQAVGFLTTFLLIFAGIALVVGAFLIVNTFSILVAQRSRELALFRALGASKRQVTGSVLAEAAVLGALGATLGIGLGVLMAMAIRSLFSTVGLDLSGQALVFQTRTFVVAYLVGVLVTMGAAWLPARRTSRIAPVQALRDDVAMPEGSLRQRFGAGMALLVVGGTTLALGLFAEDVDNGGWYVGAGVLMILFGVVAASPVISQPFLAGARVVLAALFGTVGNLAGQNSLRNPRRTTATASALMIGLALAGTMAILGDSAKASVDRSIERNFRGDLIVSNTLGQPFSPSIARQMKKVKGVRDVVAQRVVFAEVGDRPRGIAAASAGALSGLLGMEVVEGSLDRLGRGKVLVDTSYAEDEGVRVGDSVRVTMNGTPKKLDVVGVFEDNPVLGASLVTSKQTLVAAGYPDQDSVLVLDVKYNNAIVRAQVEDVVADLVTVTVKDQDAFAEEQRAPIDQLVLMIFALLGLALLIAVLGIVNTLALSVIERTREVGLLRAIGLGRPALRRMITLESVVIASLGATLGVVLGVGFGISLIRALADQGLDVVSVPWDQLGVFLVVAVVVGVLAAVLPARRAARLDVLKAIATD